MAASISASLKEVICLPKFRQVSLADIFDQQELPLGLGEYVEHTSRPDYILEIVSAPYTTLTGNIGVKVKDSAGKTCPVLLERLKRYKEKGQNF